MTHKPKGWHDQRSLLEKNAAKVRRRTPPDYGVWEPLRELRRRLIAQQNHPIYCERDNEQPLLQHLVAQDRAKKSAQRGDENGHT